MFAIYDVTGRSFRDTLENLRKVKKIQATQRSSLRLDDKEIADHHPLVSQPRAAYSAQAYRDKLQISEREAIIHAHQIMSFPVTTMQMSLSIVSAYERFRNQRNHQLPVLDKSQRIVGMLTERNLLRFMIDNKDLIKNESGKTVADAMSAPVIAADPITDVRRIAKVMLDYQQSAVPITNDQDELIGLVSRSNILQAAASDPPLSLWT
jgi:acetoin utilization protein AcuB